MSKMNIFTDSQAATNVHILAFIIIYTHLTKRKKNEIKRK